MTRWLLVLCLLLLSGCGGRLFTVSAEGLRAGATELKAAREAGQLPANDRWAECFDKVAERMEALQGKVDGADKIPQPAVVLARIHIAKMQAAAPPDPDCAQVRLELAHEAIKIGASFSSGGGSGVLDLLKGLPLPLP